MNNEANPAIVNLLQSIGYASNAIVSKTILKQPGGNITVFAFDKDEALTDHTSPHAVLLQILEGQAQLTIEENSFTLQAGEALIIPSNARHAVKAIDPFKMLLIMIKSSN